MRPLPPHRPHGWLVALLLVIGCGSESVTVGTDPVIWEGSADLLEAEDTRARTAEAWATLGAAMEDANPRVRARAARALGRLERTESVPLLLPLLEDDDPRVRAEAANGLAQALWTVTLAADSAADPDVADEDTAGTAVAPGPGPRDTVDLVRVRLLSHLDGEEDPWVRSVTALSVARLPFSGREDALAVQDVLIQVGADSLSQASLHATNVALGLFQLARRTPGAPLLSPQAKTLLADLIRGAGEDGTDAERGQQRRAALSAYALAGPPLDGETLRGALADPDPQVRRLAVRVMGAAVETPGPWIRDALADSAATVRVAALRVVGQARPERECGPLLPSLDDPDDGVASTAAELLGGPCRDSGAQRAALQRLANDTMRAWHAPAAAALALARVGDPAAREAAERLAALGTPFGRAWAARVAAELGAVPLLRALAEDSVANVRTEAVRGLAAARGAESIPILTLQLEDTDPQLVMTAATLLRDLGQPARWGPAALDALDRMSAGGHHTFRDVRMALIEAIDAYAATGPSASAAVAERLTLYARDYDPRVAAAASAVLSEATGEAVRPDPQVDHGLQVPSVRQLDAISGAAVVLAMAAGDTIRIRLLTGAAPTNAFRFARLARAGYFDGLTFHRVVQNFVIQGGSPGANEYWGDGPYSRDEVGLLHHWRGTVGLSTRGRDTGDAQIFVNLVDNLRLDFDYTIFGEVVEGMDAVDRVREGAVIARAWVEEAPG